ncbi:MAG: SBBP repeat-containing protein [Promethearchaeota archaeon]
MAKKLLMIGSVALFSFILFLTIIKSNPILSLSEVNSKIVEIDSPSTDNSLLQQQSESTVTYVAWGGLNDDYGRRLALDSHENIYTLDRTISYGLIDSDLLLMKWTPDGEQIWYRTWVGSGDDYGRGIAIDSQDHVYTIGFTAESESMGEAEFILVAWDATGIQLWNRTYSGSDEDRGFGVAVDASGNIYTVGSTGLYSFYQSDLLLVKWDSEGNQIWNRTWGGFNNDQGYGIITDDKGNIYTVGQTYSFGAGGRDLLLLKWDAEGNVVWNRTWGGVSYDEARGITLGSDGSLYTAGRTDSFSNSYDLVLIKWNTNGTKLWRRTWGGSERDYGMGVAIDENGDIYTAGHTESFGEGGWDAAVVKWNSTGDLLGYITWGGSEWDKVWGIVVTNSGTVYTTGYTYSYGAGETDLVLVIAPSNVFSTSTYSYPSFPLRTPGFLYISIFASFIVLSLLIMWKRRYKKKF